MEVFVAVMSDGDGSNYILGVYSTYAAAVEAGQAEEWDASFGYLIKTFTLDATISHADLF